MSKNKKKKKRERKILVAALLVAAITITGSTFAWFTSTDEVTNRLTADANYGVSIVESFTPPANWIPGQHVNKDVFATNTGNVAAFVEEDVAGKLNVTFENYVSSFGVNATDVEYVTVTDDEKTALEAGGYLIWTDTNEPTGEKNVKRTVGGNAAGNDYWKPTQTGFYVFRRAITDNINTTSPESEKYKLEGYYYVAANGTTTSEAFYKIMIEGNEDTTSGTNYVTGNKKAYEIEKDANGKLVVKGDLRSKIKYVTLKTVKVDAVDMQYRDAPTTGNDNRPYLEVKYKVGEGQLSSQATNAVNVANNQADVDAANALINLAKAQCTAIDTVVTAANNVKSKAEAYNTAYGNKNDTTTGSATNRTSKGEAVVAAVGAYTPQLSNQIAVSSLTETEIDASTLSASDKTLLKQYLTALNTAVGNYNSAVTALNGKVSGLGDPYTKNSTNAKQDYDDVKADLQQVETTYAALQNAAAAIDDQTLHSALTTNVAAQYDFTIDTEKGQIEALKTALSNYITAAKTDEANEGSLDSAKGDYIQAITDYNAAVASAQTDYGTATDAYNTARAKSYDINASTPGVFNTVVGEYILDSSISSVTDQSTEDVVNTSATTAATYNKSIPAEATYVVSVTGLTASSAFLDSADATKVWPLGAENATAGTETLRAILAQKTIDLNTSQTQADTLNAGAGETITINIFLDNNVGKGDSPTNTWKYIPVEGETNKARFYLNSILNGGDTSAKLIDEVVLGQDVSGKFKNLVFDLDVALASAQVTYEADNTLTAETATGFTNFTQASAAVEQNGTVTWTAKP